VIASAVVYQKDVICVVFWLSVGCKFSDDCVLFKTIGRKVAKLVFCGQSAVFELVANIKGFFSGDV